jgi:hypothetical protein
MQYPILHIHTTKELQDLALFEVLRRNGVADPEAFVRENNVTHTALFRLDAGVMTTAILSVEPIVKEADPIPLVSK